MKICLISPSRSKTTTYYTNNPRLRRFFTENKNVPGFFLPNLALLTLAGLTPQGITIKLVDERIENVVFDECFDIVGISMITAQALRGYEIAKQFMGKNIHVVLGGIHPTICPKEASEYCDTLILGEAENTWQQFLEDFARGNPKKIYSDYCVDMSRSPIPRFDLVDTSQFPIIPIQTTRGCPHNCSFCSVSTIYGFKHRTKSVVQIIKELEVIKQVSKTRRCVFNDDNMCVNKTRIYEILEAIKPLKIKYFAQTDISIAKDKRLLKLLQESGCITVFIGFENLVSENVANISSWKLKHLKTYGESCKMIQSYGIQVFGSFVVGFDFDTKDSLNRIRDFVLEHNIWSQFLILTPFPGTKVRETLITQRRLSPSNTNWDLYTCFDVTFAPIRMTTQELEENVLDLYESVYADIVHRHRLRQMVDYTKISLIEEHDGVNQF